MSQPNPPRARFNVLVPTAHGTMIVNRNDWLDTPEGRVGVGHELMQHGDYQPEEMSLLAQLARACAPGAVALDIGANIGVTTLVLAEAVGPQGAVHAFEPQRLLFQALMGNVAIASLANVHGHHMALGRAPGVIALPPLDYTRNWSFGGLNLHGLSPDPQAPSASGGHEAPPEHVNVRVLDDYGFARVDLVKLDVERMEEDVLLGGEATIARCRPLMQVEWLGQDGGRVPRLLSDWDYLVYQTGINLVCVPEERGEQVVLPGAPRLV